MWSVEDTYLDLAASSADATEHFRDQKDCEVEKLFWSQFHNPERPLAVDDRLAQWAELNRLSGLAMKYVMGHLWPGRSEPKSYFSLVQQFLDAVPRINAMKRSTCIEGARMALARVKMHWAKMKAAVMAVEGPPEGKDHRKPERYFKDVLEGARLIEGQFSNDIMFE